MMESKAALVEHLCDAIEDIAWCVVIASIAKGVEKTAVDRVLESARIRLHRLLSEAIEHESAQP
jgi:hypothetical protein